MESNKRFAAALLALCALVCAATAPAFGAEGGEQKFKNKPPKEKRFEPVVKENLADYTGRYVGLEDYYLEVKRDVDGQLSIVSQEGRQRATLHNISLTGARLTATRVYQDGTTKEFEATFVNRILNGDSRFGIMVENVEVKFDGLTFNRIFYRLDATP
ncbi:MAG TPA: hypothetical protein VGO96_03290 [Pyrinomonadaceae bacterium]|jgi:hypothetical protein|nr:hypothetical protein [Pyrinomonadaceae bacterium]